MIEIFTMDTCPYCRRVIEFLNNRGIDFLQRDINIPENAQMLMRFGGKAQVPFLLDKDKRISMYESDKIIEYLQKM